MMTGVCRDSTQCAFFGLVEDGINNGVVSPQQVTSGINSRDAQPWIDNLDAWVARE
jgi:hypothetical protein